MGGCCHELSRRLMHADARGGIDRSRNSMTAKCGGTQAEHKARRRVYHNEPQTSKVASYWSEHPDHSSLARCARLVTEQCFKCTAQVSHLACRRRHKSLLVSSLPVTFRQPGSLRGYHMSWEIPVDTACVSITTKQLPVTFKA